MGPAGKTVDEVELETRKWLVVKHMPDKPPEALAYKDQQ